MDKLTRDVAQLSLGEQCEFISTFINLQDEAAVNSSLQVVPFHNQISQCLATIEPLMVSKVPMMTLEDIRQAYLGFSHPHSPQRFKIIDLLESKLNNQIE